MAATILDGKAVAASIRDEVSRAAAEFQAGGGALPALAMFRVGEDEALLSHARSVRRSFEKAGFGFQERALAADAPMQEVVAALRELDADRSVHGILIQEPLPAQVDQTALLDLLDPLKDVDGVTPLNAGRLAQQRGHYHVASTPAGGLAILDFYKIPLQGRRAVVVGRSDIVGKPMALLLLHRHATVTIAHSRTQELARVCREAEVLVSAVGRAGIISGEMVRPDAVVVDFGINFVGGALTGDVAFEQAAAVAGAITPVPGGTGPVTGAILLRNTLQAARWLAEE